jgi:hypothetical protein
MTAKLLVCFFAFVAAVFGQDSIRVKAGDRAPDIDWNRIVSSPKSAKSQPNLAGQYTVLRFLSNVTANAQAIGLWNDLIARFEDKPVQFVLDRVRAPVHGPAIFAGTSDEWLAADR